MGHRVLTVQQSWGVYEGWIADPRVEFHAEPRGIDAAFRRAMEPFASKPASKWVGDCWLLAFAAGADATLVTFDRALMEFSRKQGHAAVIPG